MRCANCGEAIAEEPIWIDGEPYCSQECANEMFFKNEEYEEHYEEDYEEEL